ncbi:MAG: hypothetical protein HQL51_07280 [Magnetococcales bacterium]|nr:hypothetical protein [Magnetococcales bacterium]
MGLWRRGVRVGARGAGGMLAALALTWAGAAGSAEECAYEIHKADGDTVWRLNKKTGEITVCRFVDDVMTCGSDQRALERRPESYEKLQAERRQERKAELDEQWSTLERVLAIFRDMVMWLRGLEKEDKAVQPARNGS